jgi:hypothetical protein
MAYNAPYHSPVMELSDMKQSALIVTPLAAFFLVFGAPHVHVVNDSCGVIQAPCLPALTEQQPMHQPHEDPTQQQVPDFGQRTAGITASGSFTASIHELGRAADSVEADKG